MRIAFFIFQSPTHKYPGGDLLIKSLVEELKLLGHECFVTEDIQAVNHADFVVLARNCHDHNRYFNAIRLLNKPYAFIPFHDDYIRQTRPQISFFCHLASITKSQEPYPMLSKIIENPELIFYNDFIPDNLHVIDFPIYKHAAFCMANTPTEASTIQRDCRYANVEVIPLAPGQLANQSLGPTDDFLSFLPGIKKDSYILQVGRLEMRKNQLGTIFAARNLEIPIVFISSDLFINGYDYANYCIEAIKRFRKAPTYILSHVLPPQKEKNLEVIQLSENKKITNQLLSSAYANAGLYFHPAFSELPGFVYLEAAKMKTPIVASKWTTIHDYLGNEEFINYVVPYDLEEMEKSIVKNFGRKKLCFEHSCLTRTNADVALSFAQAINRNI